MPTSSERAAKARKAHTRGSGQGRLPIIVGGAALLLAAGGLAAVLLSGVLELPPGAATGVRVGEQLEWIELPQGGA